MVVVMIRMGHDGMRIHPAVPWSGVTLTSPGQILYDDNVINESYANLWKNDDEHDAIALKKDRSFVFER